MPMTLPLIDELGKLRRQEPLQPADAPQLIDLIGDSRLKPTIQLRHFVGALAQFTEQPRILHRDHRLLREILQQRDLLVGERSRFLAPADEGAEHRPILSERHPQRSTRAAEPRPPRGATDSPYLPTAIKWAASSSFTLPPRLQMREGQL
jgi:hypothetical protein